MAELGRVYPTEEHARDLLRGLVEAVSADTRIHVHTEAKLIDISGSVGTFRLAIRTGAGTIDVEAGAIVLATGFDSYVPRKGEFGYREHPEVITLPELGRMLDAGGPTGGQWHSLSFARTGFLSRRQHKPVMSWHFSSAGKNSLIPGLSFWLVSGKLRSDEVGRYLARHDI